MATSQNLIDDINLRYRNTFTTAQKLVWFNEEQRELFDILELDSPPYNFTTVAGENFYPFPAGFDITKIKVVTYQIDDAADPNYVEVESKRNDDKQYSGYGAPWYTIVSDAMYLYIPETVPADRNVYIYCDSAPTEVSSANISSAPDLPTKFQEILKFGVLKRIALARKDIPMHNGYDLLYQEKISDVMLQRKLAEPEWVTPTDTMPHAGGRWRRGATSVIITQS